MPVYNLRFTDSSKDPIVVYPKSLDGPGANRQHTDLRLYGQGAELWGEGVAEDLLRLLENFASPEVGSPPGPDPTVLANPIEGQLWLNSTDNSLYAYRPSESPQWHRLTMDGESYTKAESDTLYYEKSVADGLFVDTAGDTMTGDLVIEKSAVRLILNSTDNTDSRLDFQESGTVKGGVGLSAASDIVTLQRRDVAGSPAGLVTEEFSLSTGAASVNVPIKLNAGDPVVDADAVRKKYLEDQLALIASVPTGAVSVWAGTGSAPSGWFICDGQAINRTTYAALFGVIGTTYGAGDLSTTFNIPDLQGRTVIGQDGGTNRVTNAQADIFGGTMGAENHTLTTSQMPVHTHSSSTNSAGSHTHSVRVRYRLTGTSGVRSWQFFSQSDSLRSGWLQTTGNHTHSLTINNTGSGSSHNNMQPTMAMNWIIKT